MARLTSLEEISQPHNSSVILVTLLVDALHVHLGQGQAQVFRCANHAPARWDKTSITNLRHGEPELSDAGLEPLGLKAVGLTAPRLGALVRARGQGLLAFDLHALIDQQFHRPGHAIKAMFGQRLDDLANGVGSAWWVMFWSP